MREWLVKNKILIIAVLVLITCTFILWNVLAAKATGALQTTLIANMEQRIHGKLRIGEVDLSLSGSVRIRDVALFDAEGTLIASSPRVQITYRLSDLIAGRMNLSAVETVEAERAEFRLKEKSGRWNWQGLIKGEQRDDHLFRGEIKLAEALIHLDPHLPRALSAVTGTVGFKTFPVVSFQMKGKFEKTSFDTVGTWSQSGPGQFAIKADEIDLAILADKLSSPDNHLERGKVRNLSGNVSLSGNATIGFNAAGDFQDVVLGGKLDIRNGRGRFKADENGATFSDLAFTVSGQEAAGQGRIAWQPGIVMPVLDFSLSLPQVDPSAFVKGLAARPVAINLQVRGSQLNPGITGSFSTSEATLSDMTVGGVAGRFHMEGSVLVIDQSSGTAFQGALNAAGSVIPDSESYEMNITGQGLDSSKLTDKDVRGPLDFVGRVTGQGTQAVTRGDFTIHNGQAYGIAFRTMTGKFVKTGGKTDLSGIAIQTDLGTIYPEQLTQEALLRVQKAAIPVTAQDVKKGVADKLLQQFLR